MGAVKETFDAATGEVAAQPGETHLAAVPFASRHIGPQPTDLADMLELLGHRSLDALVDAAIPEPIRLGRPLAIPAAKTEVAMIRELQELSKRNEVWRSFIGMGYHDCFTPPMITRNILESPRWYTAYTPYQPEISQGRLEALLNYQTMVSDLTGLPLANASLLDEATAAAEAMALTLAVLPPRRAPVFLVADSCHPQTIAVLRTRAEARGVRVVTGPVAGFRFGGDVIGALVQYPTTEGAVEDYRELCVQAHAHGALVTAAADLLALTLLTPPGEWGADICVGSSQRFGVPLGFGGPHAAFFATRDEHKRHLPGRLIGVSKDRDGRLALRMALQTREQHIRREKATSNVCTAQVLLAVMAGMYAVYHGPEGLERIALGVHRRTLRLARGLEALGHRIVHAHWFDTIVVEVAPSRRWGIDAALRERRINVRDLGPTRLGIALDETVSEQDLADLLAAFGSHGTPERLGAAEHRLPPALRRASPYLTHPVFHRNRSETAMLRYMRELEARDFSLTHTMIPLGSCTMKLNATSELAPVTWPRFQRLHPFCPPEQARGYHELFRQLEAWLGEVTGLPHVSLQPNAGSQGEYAGLLAIRGWHRSRGEDHRRVCLIPQSAHGTNPASAVMAGFEVVVVRTHAERGDVDLDDLRAKLAEHAGRVAALMVTYPSTYGVFEGGIRELCALVHEAGGLVYLDGANLNAMVGLCRPGDFGADVCHINLHKTFCIPHGGGGPGMGPICAAPRLAPFLPTHPVVPVGGDGGEAVVSAAPWGSASILPISWAYIRLMGPDGLALASKVAILAANYVAKRLAGAYPVLYTGAQGLVAHECIIDLRPFKASAGIDVEDVAKRLIDYGFHPPTVSFPVAGTLMIEPTESEPKEELDRFCDAMLAIREEIRAIEDGRADRDRNVLRLAPHTLLQVAATAWDRPYSREEAAFPSAETRLRKQWPAVTRIDGAWGDRNLVCTCPPMEAYAGQS
ncbi:MAG: aminomethyl-transferring glycine dehydrogenase [Gemmatimonadales bacterium]|nr:aminomethyl-transferring glycine dehydrogenase [Gemmatimonadales bacterium]